MNETEEKELSIDTPAGLQEFLRFIEDVYSDFVVALQQTAGAEVLVSGDLLAVETARHKAQELVAHHSKVLDFGGEIFQEDITELQSLYDTIASAHDRIVTPQHHPATTHDAYEVLEDGLTGIDSTLDRAKLLAIHADELVYEFSELETAKITTPELKLGKLLYEQLKATAASTVMKVQEIERATAFGVSGDIIAVAQRVDQELDTLTQTLEQLQKSLLRFFETDTFTDQVPERKDALEAMRKNERAAKLFDQPSFFTGVVKEVLKEPRNRSILQARYSSPAAFEAALKREVYRVEAPSKLDALLGIKHESAFAFLKGMTLSAIDSFDSQARETIRATLAEKNIPYETYMAWMQAMPYLESYVEAHDDMTFIELFVRSEIEMLSIEIETARNSQGVHN